MGLTPSQASVVGSGITAAGNLFGQMFASSQQKALLDAQYRAYIENARRVGASPASIAQGLTGAGPASVPSVSQGPSMPDFGSNMVQGQAVESESEQRNIQNQEIQQRMLWNPVRWSHDVRKIAADTVNSLAQSEFHQANKRYILALADQTEKSTPWLVKRLEQGLLNDMAYYDQILASTHNQEAQAGYHEELAKNQPYVRQNLVADTQNKDADTQNKLVENKILRQDLFRARFENTFRRGGIDPSLPPIQNLFNLASTNPTQFKGVIDNYLRILRTADQAAQKQLGEHYKRNLLMMYYGAKGVNHGYNLMERRLDQGLRVLPFAAAVFGGPAGALGAASTLMSPATVPFMGPGYQGSKSLYFGNGTYSW